MTPFDTAFAAVINIERGLVTDEGGLTKYGISQRQYPNLDIANLTLDQARGIFLQNYWKKCGCDGLALDFAVCVFDAAVNEGQGTAIKILQRAVKVNDDGVMGPVTIAAAQSIGHEGLIRFMADRAYTYSHMLDFESKGHGWLARLFRIYETALKGMTS